MAIAKRTDTTEKQSGAQHGVVRPPSSSARHLIALLFLALLPLASPYTLPAPVLGRRAWSLRPSLTCAARVGHARLALDVPTAALIADSSTVSLDALGADICTFLASAVLVVPGRSETAASSMAFLSASEVNARISLTGG